MGAATFAQITRDLAACIAEGVDVVEDALHALDRFVGADIMNFSAMRLSMPGGSLVRIRGGSPLSPEETTLWEALVSSHPYVSYVSTGPMRTSRLTDVVDLSSFERTELFQRLLAPRGSRFQSALPLVRSPGETVLLSVWREHADFTDAEVRRLDLFRQALAAAFTVAAATRDLELEAAPGPPAAAGGTAGPTGNGLTRRQRQVALMVATGLTNDQIARRLGISTRTVRKHVEDLFRRTGTSSRAALAAHWQQHRGVTP